jgi:hypothetical protein
MIPSMDANPDHPTSEQAYTTFTVPHRLPQLALVLALTVIVLHTACDAITGSGSFTEAPGPMRAAAVAAISYLSIRYTSTALHHWRKNGRRRGFGPDIERIDTP